MSIPGYDAWKLASPDDDRDRYNELCPFCGASSRRQCDLEEESGGVCPWEESQPDPDDQRDQRNEDREFFANWPEEN